MLEPQIVADLLHQVHVPVVFVGYVGGVHLSVVVIAWPSDSVTAIRIIPKAMSSTKYPAVLREHPDY